MKLLSITAVNLPLFKKTVSISFLASQRVADEDKESLYNVSQNIYLNPATAFIGINASGKTSILKVVILVLKMLRNEPLNHIEERGILGHNGAPVIETVFFSNGKICRLRTVINVVDGICYIADETLWEKSVGKNIIKKNLSEFSDSDIVSRREKGNAYLPDDVSFLIARNKKENENVEVFSLLSMTNDNTLRDTQSISPEIVEFLDPTIERLYFEESMAGSLIHLKFNGEDEILLYNTKELEGYLSSGTIKGIVTFTLAMKTLRAGGYLIIDEIENHFNREIVATLLRFFMDSDLNRCGGTLIFTTHYSELLDEFDRNDSIYVLRNRDGISVQNLNEILKRNDLKKSDAYQSGFLEGTTPAYEAYMRLKKSIAGAVE